MFDVTPEEIAQLNDSDLRELVGRLCEAELAGRGHSPAFVTWGGNQNAVDGGLDVRVSLPAGTLIDGFIPRTETGFQVKDTDMPRCDILKEMRPDDTVRPVIQDLSEACGAYIIVSSQGSVADRALRSRREAMREALKGGNNAERLLTDFYDRTRLATWVRCHPGIVAWVKERLGRCVSGWHPYGPWSNAAEGVESEYLLDEKLRLRFGCKSDEPEPSLVEAIDKIRDKLVKPGKMVRLVGLSGVGKTRLVQALFDKRIGTRPLQPSFAVYTNLSDDPNPPPRNLASELIANHRHAILIIDNCPPDLHRGLANICTNPDSTISVLTVEYDVRDDLPEETDVVTLDTSSPDLIQKLVVRRHSHISSVDARTIADVSGGNARIAIAIAGTVQQTETIAGLSDDELFQRLFWQRHDDNDELLRAAEVCSLVYSFQGEDIDGGEAELPRLASLAEQTPLTLQRNIAELLRRELVQQRSVWRAVLPHALANHLAAHALENIPYEAIDRQIVTGGTERLVRSFSRRLSYLHDHLKAAEIVRQWLTPGGLLGDVTTFNDNQRAMFENVAPVLPEATLAALERAGEDKAAAALVWYRRRELLRSLAYDAPLFERAVRMLAWPATHNTNEQEAKEATDIFASLFTLYLSGTHATIDQRLCIIEPLLRSNEPKRFALGAAALENVLHTYHFSSDYSFTFGARSRNFGYQPKSGREVSQWYGAALAFIERLVTVDGIHKTELREMVAKYFRGLWTNVHRFDELERLFRSFAAEGFWYQGWVECRQTLHYDKETFTPDIAARLNALEAELKPSNLADRVRAEVINRHNWDVIDDDDDTSHATARLEKNARELGIAVANDDAVFSTLIPELLSGGGMLRDFGGGLASAASDRRATWARLVAGLERIPLEKRDVQVFRGYLTELWASDRNLAHELLDDALHEPALLPFFPGLQTAVTIDERGIVRLLQSLKTGKVPIRMYANLAVGQIPAKLSAIDLKRLLLAIVVQPDGFAVALHNFYMRLFVDTSTKQNHQAEILEIGREILRYVTFQRQIQYNDHYLSGVIKACLVEPDTALIAAEIARRLRQAVAAYEIHAFNCGKLLSALLNQHPVAVLNALFEGKGRENRAALMLFRDQIDFTTNPADKIPCMDLIAWCDENPDKHYPIAASIISFAKKNSEDTPQVWSEQAKELLIHAPDLKAVLSIFVDRFRPSGWSGSLAVLMEKNAHLLDALETLLPTEMMPFVEKTKNEFAQEVSRVKKWEDGMDRAHDERFE